MTANVVHVQNSVQKIGGNTVAQVDNAYYIMIVIKYYYCIYYCIYSMLYVCVITNYQLLIVICHPYASSVHTNMIMCCTLK